MLVLVSIYLVLLTHPCWTLTYVLGCPKKFPSINHVVDSTKTTGDCFVCVFLAARKPRQGTKLPRPGSC